MKIALVTMANKSLMNMHKSGLERMAILIPKASIY